MNESINILSSLERTYLRKLEHQFTRTKNVVASTEKSNNVSHLEILTREQEWLESEIKRYMDKAAIFDKHDVRIVDKKIVKNSHGETIIRVRGHLMDVMNLRYIDDLENDLTQIGYDVTFESPNLFLLKGITNVSR